MKTLPIILAASLFAVAASCNPIDKPEYDGMTHIQFTESDDAFPNPERGFYTVKSTKSASDSPVSSKSLQAHRKLNKTLVYMGYYPKEYIGTDIGEDFLQLIRTDMCILRENGCKCILRFASTSAIYIGRYCEGYVEVISNEETFHKTKKNEPFGSFFFVLGFQKQRTYGL